MKRQAKLDRIALKIFPGSLRIGFAAMKDIEPIAALFQFGM